MNKKVLIPVISVSAILVISGIVLGIVLTRPGAHYKKATAYFDRQQYAEAIKEYEAAGEYKDSADRIVLSGKYLAMSEGDKAMSEGNYALACEKYAAAGELDTDGAKLFEATKKNVYEMGVDYLESGEYLLAVQCFRDDRFEFEDKSDRTLECVEGLLDKGDYGSVADFLKNTSISSPLNPYYDYSLAMIAYNDEDYPTAINLFGKVDPLRDSHEMWKRSTYEFGVSLYEQGKYGVAYDSFSKLEKDYENTAEYCSNSYFMNAESLFKKGEYLDAEEIFLTFGEDYEFNGIKVSDRLNTIDQYRDYFVFDSDWRCSYGYLETKQVASYLSSWWSITDEMIETEGRAKFAKIDLDLIIDTEGEVYLKGTVEFKVYKEYSSIKKLLELKEKKYSIYEHINSTSGTIELDDKTVMKYSKDSITIKYVSKDNSTVYTTETCTSEYKFEPF